MDRFDGVQSMRVPKTVVQEAQRNAKLNMRDGFSASQCWLSAMVDMKWKYQRAKLMAVAFGFIKH